MNSKPEIVFTFPACIGGVSSFNYNIINHSNLIKKFYSKVVLIKAEEDKRPLFSDTFKADEVITFTYSQLENQYYVQKRLNQLLGSSKGAIVTDNVLTISAAKLFSNPKTVFHLIHDYFYVNQAVLVGDMADVAVAHSSFFSDAVFSSNPTIFSNRSFYIPYGVKQRENIPEKDHSFLNLVFLGRLDELKGVLILKEIDDLLQADNVTVNWLIIGKGPLEETLKEQWKHSSNVEFCQPASTEEVYDLLQAQDIFVFPTSFEGTPVSILESISNAVVPIVSDLPGGIRDIVTESIGYRVVLNDVLAFKSIIKLLYENRDLLKEKQNKAFTVAKSFYDINFNADNYFKLFLDFEKYTRKIKKSSVTFSRLDKQYIPNFIVKSIRNLMR